MGEAVGCPFRSADCRGRRQPQAMTALFLRCCSVAAAADLLAALEHNALQACVGALEGSREMPGSRRRGEVQCTGACMHASKWCATPAPHSSSWPALSFKGRKKGGEGGRAAGRGEYKWSRKCAETKGRNNYVKCRPGSVEGSQGLGECVQCKRKGVQQDWRARWAQLQGGTS